MYIPNEFPNEITIMEPYEYLWRTVKLLGPEARYNCRANTVDRWIWGYSSFGQTSTHTVTYQFDGKYCMIYTYKIWNPTPEYLRTASTTSYS